MSNFKRLGWLSVVGIPTIITFFILTLNNQLFAADTCLYGPQAIPGIIEVEDFNCGGEGVAFHEIGRSDGGLGSGIYRSDVTLDGPDLRVTSDTSGGYSLGYTRAEEWLQYPITVSETATYTIIVRVASANGDGQFHLELDGVDITGIQSVAATGGVQVWANHSVTDVVIPAGPHILELHIDDQGANYNWIQIAVSDDCAFPAQTVPGLIEVEDYRCGGEGIAFHEVGSSDGGPGSAAYRTDVMLDGPDLRATNDSGGSYNLGYTRQGEWLGYMITATETASYTIVVRVAAASSSGQFHLELDGVDITGIQSVAATGGAQVWRDHIITDVAIPAGPHTLELHIENQGANYNWIDFVVPERCIDSVQMVPSIIEVEDFNCGGEGIAFHEVGGSDGGPGSGAYRDDVAVSGPDLRATNDIGGGYNLGYTRVGEWLQYGIMATETATYTIVVRVASANSSGRFHLELDGVDITGIQSVAATGGAQVWTDYTIDDVLIPVGLHTLELHIDGQGVNYNWINFIMSEGCIFPAHAIPGLIEVEDFDCGGEGVAFHEVTNDTGPGSGAYRSDVTVIGPDLPETSDHGGGYNLGYTRAGEWLRYPLLATETTMYTVVVRVASSFGGGAFHLKLDGVDVTGVQEVPRTFGWQNWIDYEVHPILIREGLHTLELYINMAGSNYNYIDIQKVVQAPLPTTVAITRQVSGAILLTWNDFIENAGGYEAHRSNTPYFVPDAQTVLATTDDLPAGSTLYLDSAPKVGLNFYLIRSFNSDKSLLADSNRIGQFTFELNPGS